MGAASGLESSGAPGIFIFDIAQPGQIPEKAGRRRYFQGADWAILLEAKEDGKRQTLTRRITSFRKVGKLYRKTSESHRLTLYRGSQLLAELRRIGFTARLLRGYGSFRLDGERIVILARKPRRAGGTSA